MHLPYMAMDPVVRGRAVKGEKGEKSNKRTFLRGKNAEEQAISAKRGGGILPNGCGRGTVLPSKNSTRLTGGMGAGKGKTGARGKKHSGTRWTGNYLNLRKLVLV